MMNKKLLIVLSFVSLIACREFEIEENNYFIKDPVETLEVQMEIKNALSDAFADYAWEI